MRVQILSAIPSTTLTSAFALFLCSINTLSKQMSGRLLDCRGGLNASHCDRIGFFLQPQELLAGAWCVDMYPGAEIKQVFGVCAIMVHTNYTLTLAASSRRDSLRHTLDLDSCVHLLQTQWDERVNLLPDTSVSLIWKILERTIRLGLDIAWSFFFFILVKLILLQC